MTVEDTLTLNRFPVTVQTDRQTIDRIYPLKQKHVAEIRRRAAEFDIVRRIIVFGSSVTPKCTIDSDLDLCIDADVSDGLKVYKLQKTLGEICDWNCDIIMYANMGHTLKQTAAREGVVIYDRSYEAGQCPQG